MKVYVNVYETRAIELVPTDGHPSLAAQDIRDVPAKLVRALERTDAAYRAARDAVERYLATT